MFGLLLAGAYFPLPVPYQLDFQVIYLANKSLLHGIPLYDHAAQVQYLGLSKILPFPYPPWYALVMLPLAWLRIDVAARLWLELNLVMLLLSVWLLTDGWKPRMRLAAFPVALMFIPVLGALYVGQYIFPVLLGSALLIFSLRRESPLLTALAAALLTFKPHLGGLILLALLVHLWLRRDSFGRLALRMIFLTGLGLFIVGFLADHAWPISYFDSLLGFKGASECRQCISLPMFISTQFGWGLDQAIPVAGFLLIGLVGFFSGRRSWVWKDAEWIVPVSVCIVLSASPYLQSYDFAFLLVPLFFLLGRSWSWAIWVGIGLAYSLPWLRLSLPVNRGGDTVILVSALLVSFLVFVFVVRKSLDLPPSNLYNQENSLREE